MNALRRFFTWIKWIVRAAVFFVLFAFAINNQQAATLHLMFGYEWRAPMTMIVLAAFALGLVVGVLGMLPSWWRRGVKARPASPATPQTTTQTAPETVPTPSTLPAREL